MSNKAKHAHGSRQNLDSAISNKVVDAYDVLFLSGEDENPAIGWLNKEGEAIVICPGDEIAALGTEVDAKLAEKADSTQLEEIRAELSGKVGADEIDAKVSAAMENYSDRKYEIADLPVGSLVDYGENEIRVMCPADAVYEKQSVGAGGDPDSYYIILKTFAPCGEAVGYIEHLGDSVDAEILTDLRSDGQGHRYQPTWLAVAKYDEATDSWNYYGSQSDESKFIGWDYQIDWFNADGVMITSDSVRINLSNEDCHFSNKPYYVGGMMSNIDEKISEKLAEMEAAYTIVEF